MITKSQHETILAKLIDERINSNEIWPDPDVIKSIIVGYIKENPQFESATVSFDSALNVLGKLEVQTRLFKLGCNVTLIEK